MAGLCEGGNEPTGSLKARHSINREVRSVGVEIPIYGRELVRLPRKPTLSIIVTTVIREYRVAAGMKRPQLNHRQTTIPMRWNTRPAQGLRSPSRLTAHERNAYISCVLCKGELEEGVISYKMFTKGVHAMNSRSLRLDDAKGPRRKIK
ncbi:hypothetical protein ANN_15429 [Periplaneta americana]|uniref:Uncharacterized protein n=1 Tax=Periplaneta americana TaxID=6978 RepID=A0ABQ8SHH1_PERAM|nr:hypothetical protein ANN_15429 [Periplaneta americana]